MVMLLLLLVSLMSGSALAQTTSLTVRADKAVASEPATIRLSIRVPKSSDNRVVCILMESDRGYFRSSCFDHIGTDAPLLVVQPYRDLYAGRYEVLVVLQRVSEEQTARTHFRVLGLGDTE